MRRTFILATMILTLAVGTSLSQTVINYGNQILHPSFTATGFSDVWDLTQGDLVLSYTIDMTGVSQPGPWQTSYTEVGIREMGASNFNPGPFNTYQGGKGGWMTSLVGDLTPSPNTQSLHDKHNLAASGGRDERDYDATDPGTVVAPFGTNVNYGIWFDRDGVDPFQALNWGMVDGGTYNTGGVYHIEITYHAVSSTLGTMFATINGIQTGFYTAGWKNAQPDIYPAGLSFKGDMSKMQVFAGLWAPGTSFGDVAVSDITASGYLSCKFNFVFLADDNVKIDGNQSSEGNIHSNGRIDFKKGMPGTHTGNLTAVDDIKISKNNTIIGDVKAGDDLYLRGNATVTGATAGHATVTTIALPHPSFTAGGPAKTVSKNGTVTLAPGTYGKVKVKKNGTLNLSAGDYFMDALDTDKNAKLVIDVSGGPVNINLVKELEFDDQVEVVINPSGQSGTSLVTFTSLQKNKIDIGDDATILGTIIASKAEVHFNKGSRFKGSICAKKVTVEKGVPFLPHNSTTPLPKVAPVTRDFKDMEQITEKVTGYELSQNYPNPFNPSTTIRFSLPEAGPVYLAVYNTTGRLVRTLVSGNLSAGNHDVVWDATDDQGRRVASGVYLYTIKAGKFIAQRKLVLMK